MQMLSSKLDFVKTSATASIHNLIIKKQKFGEKIINLSVGEPDFEIMYPDPGFPIYESVIRYSGATPLVENF